MYKYFLTMAECFTKQMNYIVAITVYWLIYWYNSPVFTFLNIIEYYFAWYWSPEEFWMNSSLKLELIKKIKWRLYACYFTISVWVTLPSASSKKKKQTWSQKNWLCEFSSAACWNHWRYLQLFLEDLRQRIDPWTPRNPVH